MKALLIVETSFPPPLGFLTRIADRRMSVDGSPDGVAFTDNPGSSIRAEVARERVD
jgi:hypothetical protein